MTVVISDAFVKQTGDQFFSHLIKPHRYHVVSDLLRLELAKRVRMRQLETVNVGKDTTRS